MEMSRPTTKKKKLVFFGHFGRGNFGNESTLQAALDNIGRRAPDAELMCICTGPAKVEEDYAIRAVAISTALVQPWKWDNTIVRMLRKVAIGIPSECYRWLQGLMMLRDAKAFIVPGTGLLTDAYSLVGWGPYSTFKWVTIAKLCRCRVMFVGVGAGPLYSRAGRFFVISSLALADFRSYRDKSTVEYLEGIGFPASRDKVCPDLAFSLADYKSHKSGQNDRPVVGVGVMEYAGRYSVDSPSSKIYRNYLEALVGLAGWLLAHDYDVRVLIGDVYDRAVVRDFRELLKARAGKYDEDRIVEFPIDSVPDVMAQIANCEFVVATRFHNVLLALLLNKPTIAVAFHHKCVSLMDDMGLSRYCMDINNLDGDSMIECFQDLETNGNALRHVIQRRSDEYEVVLDDQYDVIVSGV